MNVRSVYPKIFRSNSFLMLPLNSTISKKIARPSWLRSEAPGAEAKSINRSLIFLMTSLTSFPNFSTRSSLSRVISLVRARTDAASLSGEEPRRSPGPAPGPYLSIDRMAALSAPLKLANSLWAFRLVISFRIFSARAAAFVARHACHIATPMLMIAKPVPIHVAKSVQVITLHPEQYQSVPEIARISFQPPSSADAYVDMWAALVCDC